MRIPFKAFAADERGAVAVMLALASVVLFGALGAALDYSFSAMQRTQMRQIADSAAIAGAVKLAAGGTTTEAIAEAQKYLIAEFRAANIPYTDTTAATTTTVTVPVNATRNTFVGGFVGMPTMKIGVSAVATIGYKPSSTIIKVTNARGYWYKLVSIVVVPEGQTAETTVGTVEYQPTTHSGNGGLGSGTTKFAPTMPTSGYALGKYTKLYLKMQVKQDGCPVGKYNQNTSSNTVTCKTTTAAASQKYDSTMRTDDPATVNYLFVGGVQLTAGSTPPLTTLLPCNTTQSHAWEDGGGFASQDFFYNVTTACDNLDQQSARLTQ